MVDYEVTVFTGDLAFASTFDNVYIKLVGSDESKRTLLPRSWISSFFKGTASHFTISCPASLGQLTLIELDKQTKFFQDSWYLAKVEVISPEGHTYSKALNH